MSNAQNLRGLPELSPKKVSFFSEANIPTEYGPAKVIIFKDQNAIQNKNPADEHMALVFGEVHGKESVLVRIHSECWTGEVLRSLKCDCREQFDAAITTIAKAGQGVILYLRQEGRGIGLGNKIKAYALQEKGLDTFEANRILGFEDDMRDFTIAGEMLSYLGVQSVCLLTNNPLKFSALQESGINLINCKHLPATLNPHNHAYIKDKNSQMGHDIRICDEIKINGNSQILFSAKQIDAHVEELACKIAHDYKGQELVTVGILPNSLIFYSDLLRRIWNIQNQYGLSPTLITCGFIGLQQYMIQSETIFEGIFKSIADLSVNITDKRALLIDTISHTGATISYLCENLRLRRPLDIKTCTLFTRPHKNSQDTFIDYVGHKLESDNFLLGYGMGYYNRCCNFPYISRASSS